jgi:ABC-type phosphate transport system substrate-binding protein
MVPRTFFSVLLLLVLVSALPAHAQDSLAVIVGVDRTADLSREEVGRIFLKQRRFWREGEPIVPVNRNASSAARELFTNLVFHQPARSLKRYWNRQYYQGVLPPITLASDEAVKRFIVLEPQAIGYIDATLVDESVRVVLVLVPAAVASP